MGRPRHATVVAYLALFIALGGTTYAASKLTGKDIKDGSLTTKDVKNRSLLARDFKKGQLRVGTPSTPGAQGESGAQGPQGEQGPQGDPGPKGDSGPAGKDGIDGKDGAPGADGSDGAAGHDGAPGPAGKDGLDGKDGAPGKDGINGEDGAPGKDGVDGKDGAPGAPGTDGTDGKDGAPGPAGIAKGYAEVNPDGTFTATRSKGVVGVQVAGASSNFYCFDLDFAPKAVVGMPFSQSGAVGIAGRVPVVGTTFMPCDSAHSDAVVNTFFTNTGLDTPVGFYVFFE
jgi:hypothetical protein